MNKLKIVISLLLCFTCIFCFSFSAFATSGNDIFQNETEDYNEAQLERNNQIKKLIVKQLDNAHESYLIQNEISNESGEAKLMSLNDVTREEYIRELEASNEKLYQEIINLGGSELPYDEFEELYYSNGIRLMADDDELNKMYTELRKNHYVYMLDYNITLGKNQCNPGTTYQVKQICIVPFTVDPITQKEEISESGQKHLMHYGEKEWKSREANPLKNILDMSVKFVGKKTKDFITKNSGPFSVMFDFIDIMEELKHYASGGVETFKGRDSIINTRIYTTENMSYVFVKVKGVWQPILSSNMIVATDVIHVDFPIRDTVESGVGNKKRYENEKFYNEGEMIAANLVHSGKTTLHDEVWTSLGFEMHVPMNGGKTSDASVYTELNPCNTLQLFYLNCRR